MSPAWFGALFGILCTLDCVTTGYALRHRSMYEGNGVMSLLMEKMGMRAALILSKLALVAVVVTYAPEWSHEVQPFLIALYVIVVAHNYWLLERQ